MVARDDKQATRASRMCCTISEMDAELVLRRKDGNNRVGIEH